MKNYLDTIGLARFFSQIKNVFFLKDEFIAMQTSDGNVSTTIFDSEEDTAGTFSLVLYPSCVYKNEATTLVMSGTTKDISGNTLTVSDIKFYKDSDTVENLLASATTVSTLSATVNNLTVNTVPIDFVGTCTYDNKLTKARVRLQARYPIYCGFGAENDGGYSIIVSGNERLSARTDLKGTETGSITNSNGDEARFYILVPEDIENPSRFTMGSVDFVVTKTNATITVGGVNVNYSIYKSASFFNEGAVVNVKSE